MFGPFLKKFLHRLRRQKTLGLDVRGGTKKIVFVATKVIRLITADTVEPFIFKKRPTKLFFLSLLLAKLKLTEGKILN